MIIELLKEQVKSLKKGKTVNCEKEQVEQNVKLESMFEDHGKFLITELAYYNTLLYMLHSRPTE